MTEPSYTPTEAEVRSVWSIWRDYGGLTDAPRSVGLEEGAAEFDRLIAQVRAESRREGAVEALREAAHEMEAEYERRTAQSGSYGQMKIRAALKTAAGMVRLRADRIEARL